MRRGRERGLPFDLERFRLDLTEEEEAEEVLQLYNEYDCRMVGQGIVHTLLPQILMNIHSGSSSTWSL